VIYAGTDIGVFYSSDGGGFWELLGNGLPAVVINDMKIHPDTHELIAGTHGRSMYRLDLYKVVSIEDKRDAMPSDFYLAQNYPNPFNPSTVISYQLSVSSKIELSVFNTLGQRVKSLVSSRQGPGVYSIDYNGSGLAGGVYYYRLTTDTGISKTRKMVLLR